MSEHNPTACRVLAGGGQTHTESENGTSYTSLPSTCLAFPTTANKSDATSFALPPRSLPNPRLDKIARNIRHKPGGRELPDNALGIC